MSQIRLLSPSGRELTFITQIEFLHAMEGGGITADWSIYHQSGGQWLPIIRHPAFRASADPVSLGPLSLVGADQVVEGAASHDLPYDGPATEAACGSTAEGSRAFRNPSSSAAK